VNDIQNSSLPERKVRDLNDEINRLIREKSRWERRILDLGGPNYFAQSNRILEEMGGGRAVGGGKGEYKYFGQAKNLPEVQSLFKQQAAVDEMTKKPGRRAHELHRGLDAEYYGFRDDDDGVLQRIESAQESKLVAKALQDWHKEHEGVDLNTLGAEDSFELPRQEFLAPSVDLPTREEIESALLEKRKEELLRKFTGIETIESVLEMEQLRNIEEQELKQKQQKLSAPEND